MLAGIPATRARMGYKKYPTNAKPAEIKIIKLIRVVTQTALKLCVLLQYHPRAITRPSGSPQNIPTIFAAASKSTIMSYLPFGFSLTLLIKLTFQNYTFIVPL
jgi:hypothetical protein